MESKTSDDVKLSPELAALAAEGAAIDAEATPAPPPEIGPDGQPAPVDYLGDAKGLMDILAETLAAFYPSTAAVLTDDKRARIAAAAAPVMEKYGFSLGGFMARFGPEINLAFVAAPVALSLANAIRADRAAAKRAEKGEEAAARPDTPMQPIIERTDPTSLHTRA